MRQRQLIPAYCRTTRQPIRQTMARASKGKTRKSTSKVKKEPAKASSSRMAAATKVKSELINDDSSSNAVRPTAEECLYATASLALLHPDVVDRNEERRKTLLESCGLRDSITDSVISTMLSQNTTDKNSKQAWGQLVSFRSLFPEFNFLEEFKHYQTCSDDISFSPTLHFLEEGFS